MKILQIAQEQLLMLEAQQTKSRRHAIFAQVENILAAIDQQLSAFGKIFLELYNSAIELDNQLRQDYKEIDALQACANRLGSLLPSQNQTVNSSDDMLHRLRMDVRGIFAATLLKHKVIERIDESLQQVADSGE